MFNLFKRNKKEWYNKDRHQLVRDIERDVYKFVTRELITYKQNTNNKTLGDSVVANLALFDLAALNFKEGIDQMENLLRDHQNQMVNRRLSQLLHTLYIRYGIDQVDDIANDALFAMVGVYKLNNTVISNLDDKYNVFWMIPFIREAYFVIMNNDDYAYPESENK